MRKTLLNFLRDPATKKELKLQVFEENSDIIESGLLLNENNWYPIINGIPRMFLENLRKEMFLNYAPFFEKYRSQLPSAFEAEKNQLLNQKELNKQQKHQLKTKKSFSFEWKNLYQENTFEMENFLHFIRPLEKTYFQNKACLDVGCGSGRFTKTAALCGAKLVIGLDFGECVEVARQITVGLNNVEIVQADIYNLPFDSFLDVAFSIGVLHHLPQPQEGFNSIPKTLKVNGEVILWVYDRPNNKRAIFLYEPLRKITTKIPKSVLKPLCHIPALVVHTLNLLTKALEKLKSPLVRFIPFNYYTNFPYSMKFNDSFDVLATPKSNYYSKEDIEKWFKEAGLTIKDIHYVKETGITGYGQKV